jgi:hypothetical protein
MVILYVVLAVFVALGVITVAAAAVLVAVDIRQAQTTRETIDGFRSDMELERQKRAGPGRPRGKV